MKPKFRVIFGREDGKGGTIWNRAGMIFEKEGGKLKLKLDSLPLDSGFKGWFEVVEYTDERPPQVQA